MFPSSNLWFTIKWIGLTFVFAIPLPLSAADPKPTPVDFEKEIQPLLAKNCIRCHGEEQQEAKLRLDTLDGVLIGGKSGPAVVPKKSALSPLILALRGERPFRRMPSDAPSLSAKEIGRFAEWIDSLPKDQND